MKGFQTAEMLKVTAPLRCFATQNNHPSLTTMRKGSLESLMAVIKFERCKSLWRKPCLSVQQKPLCLKEFADSVWKKKKVLRNEYPGQNVDSARVHICCDFFF
jgi:hypothetical protein